MAVEAPIRSRSVDVVEKTSRGLFWFGFLVIALQRFGVTVGDFVIPVTAVIGVVVTVAMVARRRWLIAPIRLVILLAFFATGLVSLAVNDGAFSGASSLLFVILLWLPAAVAGRDAAESREKARSFASGLVLATALAGALGAVQSGISFVTRSTIDPVGLLPPEILVPGFRAAQPVSFGSSWMKANGFIFLEPSFLSLVSAVGLVFVLSGFVGLRRKGLLVAALLVGMTTSVAISGVIILPVLFIMLIASPRRAVYTFMAAAIAVPVVNAIPVTKAFTDRLFYMQGSNDARLVRPYTELLPVWLDGPLAFGFGPGSARELADVITADNWQTEVTTPTAVKVLFEYGLVGAVVLSALVIVVVARSAAPLPVKAGLAIMLIVPTDGLTSHLIVPCLLFVLLGSTQADKKNQNTPHWRGGQPYQQRQLRKLTSIDSQEQRDEGPWNRRSELEPEDSPARGHR
jgi:hypothetical protein